MAGPALTVAAFMALAAQCAPGVAPLGIGTWLLAGATS
jgi:hypothetical protein